MKCDIEGIRRAVKILKNAKKRLEDTSDIIDNLISRLSDVPKIVPGEQMHMYGNQQMSMYSEEKMRIYEQQMHMYEEQMRMREKNYAYVKNELKSLRSRINGSYISLAKSIKKWIVNKADKLEESEKLNENVLLVPDIGAVDLVETGDIGMVEEMPGDGGEIVDDTVILGDAYQVDDMLGDEGEMRDEKVNSEEVLESIAPFEKIKELSKEGRYFTQKELNDAMSKVVTCSSDEEFEKIYKKSKLNGDVSKLESFRYNGKIYVRKNASDMAILFEINREIAIQKRNSSRTIKKPSSVPTQGINKALAEYATRSLYEGEVLPLERKEEYDISVDYLEYLNYTLSNRGYNDLVMKTSYGTKKELKTALRDLTGSDDYYNTMLNAMYTLTENPNATEKEKKQAKKQLELLKTTLEDINEKLPNEEDDKKPDNTVTKTIDGQKVNLPEGDKVYFLDTCWEKDNAEGKAVQRGSDCFIIESKDENGNPIYGMIDSGTEGTSERVTQYLKELGIKELDFVLITHGHEDHTGGYQAIVDSGVKVKNLYMKRENSSKHLDGVEKTVNSYNTDIDTKISKAKTEKEKKELEKQKTTIHWVNNEKNKEVKENQSIKLGTWDIQLFNTTDNIRNTKRVYTNEDGEKVDMENVNTITALATSNGKSVYFSGDIGNYTDSNGKKINAGKESAQEVQDYLKKKGLDTSIDVYKTAHHSRGLDNNSQKEINILNPKNSVSTIGKKRIEHSNKTDFQKANTRIEDKVDKAGGEMYYTAQGTVVMNVTDQGDLSFKQMDDYYADGDLVEKKKAKDPKSKK